MPTIRWDALGPSPIRRNRIELIEWPDHSGLLPAPSRPLAPCFTLILHCRYCIFITVTVSLVSFAVSHCLLKTFKCPQETHKELCYLRRHAEIDQSEQNSFDFLLQLQMTSTKKLLGCRMCRGTNEGRNMYNNRVAKSSHACVAGQIGRPLSWIFVYDVEDARRKTMGGWETWWTPVNQMDAR